ncbi:MAG: pyridoxamine 5'-phosphate oxidase family protein [Proteobacteria bacterium]|nr:pyridoxamine 5'-phosphate oxidase family protein [Pseudomonadota bacterium]
MPTLTYVDRDAFLAERGILMRIAVVREDGSPLVTPIWFIHRDNAIYFTPREKSEWFACLRHNSRVALCIDEQPHPYRKVIIEGDAELVHDLDADDLWRDLYREIAGRYVSEAQANAYVENTIEQPRGLFRVNLSKAKVRSWRMPVEGEPAMGIWHDRYYKEGTAF